MNLTSETTNTDIVKLIQNKLDCKDQNIKINKNLFAFHKALSIDDHEIINNMLKTEDINNLMSSNWGIFWPGCTAMHLAVHYNNIQAVEILIKKGADIIVKDFREKTPLHLAFESNQREMVNLILLQAPIKGNPADDHGLSHFHIACTMHNLVAVENFIRNRVDVNERVKLNSPFWPGFTSLHFAVRFEASEVVELLINNNADITLKNGLGLTLIDEVLKSDSWSDNYKILESLLLERERKNLDSLPNRGITLLHTACMKNDIELIKNRLNPINLNSPVKPISPLWAGFTPLHIAVYLECSEAVSLLVKSGANLSAKDALGYTPLFWDVEQRQEMNVDLISEDNNPVTEDGRSFFHLACKNDKNLEAVKRFLKVGVNVNERVIRIHRDAGQTPLHLSKSTEVVRLLLVHGADVNARDDELQTPLHKHCTWFYDTMPVIVEMLLEAGAEVDALDRFGRTPLLHAILYDDPQSVAVLLKHGADINATSHDGKVALDGQKIINDIKVILLKHIRKLIILGFYVSAQNVTLYHCEKQKCSDFNEPQFNIECRSEINNMNLIKISEYANLKDIPFKNANQMTRYAQNVIFKDILHSDDFDTRFPIYGYLLKLQLKRGIARKSLMSPAEESLKFLIGAQIPTVCIDKICEFLNDEDLKNVILFTKDILENK